jgi:glycosyltransferase involved in cell wall biosynthesis
MHRPVLSTQVLERTMPPIPTLRVSVIVPCRNERKYIERFLHSLLRQERSGLVVEFLIADGGSIDGTREILESYAERCPLLRVFDNPDRTVSAGLNRLIHEARGEVIIRMDVHTEYALNYIHQCVRVLEQTNADNVGGPARTRANSYFQQAASLAYHSPFSSGGVAFHDPDYEGYVDTVTYGCWRKTTLERLGLFDEELVRNQDDELNLRLSRMGGKIWQSPSIESWYYPRSTLSGLFRQYAQYGYWKVRVIQKHRLPASFRHLVPGLFVASLLLLGLVALVSGIAAWIFGALIAVYFTAAMAASVAACSSAPRLPYLPVMPLVFATYHFGYGYGFLRGLIDFALRRHRSKRFSAITRE